jgi:alkylation response protein AidB-like acyl-CoA dehydrogenase
MQEFETSQERTDLRAAVRQALAVHGTSRRIREAMESESGMDEELWKVLTTELGLTSLWLTSEEGTRSAGDFGDLAAALDELGRGPACAPILGSAVLAPALLRACSGPAAQRVIDGLAAGTLRATAALQESSVPAIIARAEGEAVIVDGIDPFVLDLPSADVVLIPALLGGTLVIIALDTNAAGLVRTPLSTMDQTRRAAHLELRGTPGALLRCADPAAALRTARLIALTALAAEQVGGAARCLEITLAYVKARHQFGVPIGSFQAVKHACADMAVAVEFARSAAEYAAFCVDQRPEDLPIAALTAASLCAENYLKVAEKTIQLHGGVGFTWDNDAHLFFKRAKSTSLLFGQPVQSRAELADLLSL